MGPLPTLAVGNNRSSM